MIFKVHKPMNTMIKVCGMTDADNIRDVEVLGVDMIGFIFYPKSPQIPVPDTQVPAYACQTCRCFCQRNQRKHPYVCRPFRSELHPVAR